MVTNSKTILNFKLNCRLQLLKIVITLEGYRFMVFNATFNNISVILWWSVLFVEETGVPGENHRPATSHWQTLSHNVVLSKLRLSGIQTHVNGVNLIRYARNQKIGQPNNFARLVRFMVFNNISVISWRSVLLVEETGVPGENHRPVETRKSLTNFIT